MDMLNVMVVHIPIVQGFAPHQIETDLLQDKVSISGTIWFILKSTGDAITHLTLVDLSQFNVDAHFGYWRNSTTRSWIIMVTECNHQLFHWQSGSITVNTSGNGAHNHTISQTYSQYQGGGTDDGGPGVPGSK